MNRHHNILFLLIIFSCSALVTRTAGEENNIVKWNFLSIDPKDQLEVEKLNKEIILTVLTGHIPTQNGYIDREITLQKKTQLYQEIINCVNNNKKDSSKASTEVNCATTIGIKLSCFVASVFLPEMAIALKKDDTSFFLERFEQTLCILPITDDGYSYVITPLFALIPQGVYYSNIPNSMITKAIKIVDHLLDKCKTVIISNQNNLNGKLYFLKKNIISLETLRMNLLLMNLYQKNQRWPAKKDIENFPMFFATKIDYHESDGSLSYQLVFSKLEMKAEVSVMPKEKNAEIVMKKVKTWVPFKITPIK